MEIIRDYEALQQAIRSNQITVVQFGSAKCAPCSALQNKLIGWNRTHPAVCHVYVSVDEQKRLSAQMEVFTVPAVFVYVQGRLTIRSSGWFSLEEIFDRIEQVEQLLASQPPEGGEFFRE